MISMQTPIKCVWLLAAAAMLAGCLATTGARVTSSGGADMQAARAEAYNGPKARVAVIDFEDKMSSTRYYRAEYGRGMADMLTTALFQTNRYIVLERENIGAVEAERRRYGRGNQPRLEDADILIKAAITGFDPGTAGAKGGLSGLLGGKLKGLTGSFKKAHVAMDLRVIDVSTGRVISATSVEGNATSFGAGGAGIGGAMAGTLSGFAKSPMETAIRNMIVTAVDHIVAQTPETYYRYQ